MSLPVRRALLTSALLLTSTAVPVAAIAQDARTTIGAEGAVLGLRVLDEGPVGGGLRVSVRPGTGRVVFDTSVLMFPENPSGNFGERLWLSGVRVRLPIAGPRLFARLRAGRIHFGGSYFEARLSDRTHTAFDVGLTLERRLGSRLLGSLDVGDLVIPFGGASYLGLRPTPERLGTAHNLLMAIGLAWELK